MAVQKGWDEVVFKMLSEKYDLIILDEICITLYYHLIDLTKVLQLLKDKPAHLELVLTEKNI